MAFLRARRPIPFPEAEIVTDPLGSAKAAGLRYVYDTRPGIRRRRYGKGFRYIGVDGSVLQDPEVLSRIRSLAIPPAWTNVWICNNPNGHLQATGRDAKGRKQSRYHPRWREVRDEAKYERMILFGEALPRIRQRVEHDLALPGLPREKVLATIVRLLETTFIRVGNEEYARTNHSYGLTTMRNRHVTVSGATVRFCFEGKSGVKHNIDVNDRRLAKIVKRCYDMPGYELFQYLDAEGSPHSVDASDVNEYLRGITDQPFTAKDFRTWAGSVMASIVLQEFAAYTSETEAKRNIVQAIKRVAAQLGNTPAVCRKCYVHPVVLERYLTGGIPSALRRAVKEAAEDTSALREEERALMDLLSHKIQAAAA
ncbi:MAG: DNA topoisomerase IB [Acidobacteriota bacterium]|nr:DNA topoisomerase IB [Acidobacteriota bacterium]